MLRKKDRPSLSIGGGHATHVSRLGEIEASKEEGFSLSPAMRNGLFN